MISKSASAPCVTGADVLFFDFWVGFFLRISLSRVVRRASVQSQSGTTRMAFPVNTAKRFVMPP